MSKLRRDYIYCSCPERGQTLNVNRPDWDVNSRALVVPGSHGEEIGLYKPDESIMVGDQVTLGIGGIKVLVDVATPADVMTGTLKKIDEPLSIGLNLYPADMVSFERRHVFSLTKEGGL